MRPGARVLVLAAFGLLAAAPANAQREAPRRPRLAADADTNDARAYYRRGEELLARPRQAAEAFYWAGQLDPGWPEALYARYATLLLADRRRMVLYLLGDPRTLAQPEVAELDSLYARALRLDPFLRLRFEREMALQFVHALAFGVESDPRSTNPNAVMQMMPPLLRGRVLAGEGRLLEARDAYDEALRERGREAFPPRLVRHERARMYVLAGNDSMAGVELRLALEAGAADEATRVSRVYESKALLEHGMAVLHERAGDRDAAREAYARALVEDLSYAPAHLWLGALALTEGDTATGLREMATAAELARGDPPTRLAYATALAALNRLPEAETELRAVIDVAPYFADPWLLLGMVREWRGEGDADAAFRGFLARARRDDPRRVPVQSRAAPPAP
jgi:hypothetical protein